MLRPAMFCDDENCEKEIVDHSTGLKVVETNVYGMDEVKHFCNFTCLKRWIDEQMEDDNSVSVG